MAERLATYAGSGCVAIRLAALTLGAGVGDSLAEAGAGIFGV